MPTATVRAVCPGVGARAIAGPASSRPAAVRLPTGAVVGTSGALKRGTSATRLRAWPKWFQPSEASKTPPAKAESPPPMPDSKATIDALCDILGDECDDEEAKRQAEEEEADRLRAEHAAAIEAEKSRKGERLKAFRAVSTSTLRLQQLQMVFLDLPILPTPLHDFFLGSDAEAAKSEKSATIADLPDVDWFDVTLPSDDSILGAKTTEPSASKSAKSASDANTKGANEDGSVRASVASLIGAEDLTPAYLPDQSPGEKLPGEFSIPIVPYPFVCLPGSRVRLNLFEPRWLTLFAKLMRDPSDAVSDTAPLVLEGARDNSNRIDLSRNPFVRAYEDGDDAEFDIVPGAGRMDEGAFMGTEQFGALYRRADGKVAGVGTAMRLVAHDVVVNGKLLSVYAKGETRFKVLRVRQVNPYLVVDAVPLVAADASASASASTSSSTSASDSTSASGSGSGEFGGDAAFATNVGGSMDSNEADVVLSSSRSATALASCMERLMVADPYYAEAVGLGEAWTMDKSLKKSVGAMNEFDVANAVLYAKPEAALRVLATGSDEQRKEAVLDAVRGMEAALAAGLTPRKARLLRSLGAMVVIFGIGFGIASVRQLIEMNVGDGGGMPPGLF